MTLVGLLQVFLPLFVQTLVLVATITEIAYCVNVKWILSLANNSFTHNGFGIMGTFVHFATVVREALL